ncbi:DUF3320 domain-containing protein [Aliiroseovarius lamellibrachiae]|uniref:DUF3320 domain-containing protein n=1 Tax=Aliiroseovarius lamellibrachiae TaxID=1924933 RepID=UPI001BE03E9F|nr:DUF3320 domain-containing protein [Aliiroseovarius lamellibrachiae]MBT2131034.1 DUF3320 domain-containing protein [Aliiroseovarius lamellibrachiae]
MNDLTPTRVISVLEDARRKLLETGTRNRLIHVNRKNQRANCLNLINERSDDVFELLRSKSRRMRFKAMGWDKEVEDPELRFEEKEITEEVSAERYTDLILETPLGPEALQKRVLRMAGAAKTAEEEQGVNILFLALGFLKWRESENSEVERNSPLILLPVELVRNERTSTYDVRCREEDITTNLPLQERLKQDYGIALPEIEEGEEWKPHTYFDSVRDVIGSKPGWSVEDDGMQMGFFSFAKLLMHRDLAPENWPDGELDDNPLLKQLIAEGFESDGELFGKEDKLDEILDPADIIQIVDADASQTKVIEEVRKGASLVVQGPPGTGKSQTISNIIAAAVHDGKRVLFVAEKMAALSVVHERLVKSGLRDVCLELHSRSSNKKALAQELGRTLMASLRGSSAVNQADELRHKRDELNRISNLLHTPIVAGEETAFGAIAELSRFIGREVEPPRIPVSGLEKIGPDVRREILGGIHRFVVSRETVGSPEHHPFFGVRSLNLQPTDIARLRNELNEAVAAIEACLNDATNIAKSIGVEAPSTLAQVDRISSCLDKLGEAPVGSKQFCTALFERSSEQRLTEALAVGESWAAARKHGETDFNSSAWDAELRDLRSALLKGKNSFFSRLFGSYRKASSEFASYLNNQLPKAPDERLALLDKLADIQRQRATLAEEENYLSSSLGEHWRGERTSFSELQTVQRWLSSIHETSLFASSKELVEALSLSSSIDKNGEQLRKAAAKVNDLLRIPLDRLKFDLEQISEYWDDTDHVDLEQILRRFKRIEADHGRYSEWTALANSTQTLVDRGAGDLVTAVNDGRVETKNAEDEFLYACAEARWAEARRLKPELEGLAELDRSDLVAAFSSLDRKRIEDARSLILARHSEQIPKGSVGQMGIIRGEIGRKRGHKPVRWIMKNAGEMVQRMKPVFLMSPISVAQYLTPGSLSFDLLVIDEASQIRPEDAFGVIARAKQIVVVGDEKQLPPTSFFDRLVDSGDEESDEAEETFGASAADMESILTACSSRGMRQRMLEWHYRSRDPSLIRMSNSVFYEGNLVLPPSPLEHDDNYGLKFHRVPGVYSRGKSGPGRTGTNKIEAQAVVAEIAKHARDWPDLSLGVVAFSKSQADMLTEVLEHARRNDPVLDGFLREGQREDVFVKNIENVQGDERDVILISVGYGPTEPNGRLPSMSFGPINGEGGERRLNVLFTRSRVRCSVFASFNPGDIDPARTTREGPKVLKRFLEYAKSGILDDRAPTGLDADSPFEEDVAQVIKGMGYLVDPQVGSAGFRIDLGVRHPDQPGQYIAAVECDGATYHSALWARERDRLRQDILENLGWEFHRIWSTDWFYRRDAEIERLRLALTKALEKAGAGIAVTGANDGRQLLEETAGAAGEISDQEVFDVEQISVTAPLYERADLNVNTNGLEPHEAPISQLVRIVTQIVEREGPIHVEELARRVSASFGRTRAGRRIVEVTKQAVQTAERNSGGALLSSGRFLFTKSQSEVPPVRDRSEETGNVVKAAYLPPMEIKAASEKLTEECGYMEMDDLVRATARLLGFKRVGADLNKIITDTLTEGR